MVSDETMNAARTAPGGLDGALPHLGALAAGVVILAVWLFGTEFVPAPLQRIAIFAVFGLVMAAPLIGASIVLRVRPAPSLERRKTVLRPYQRWALGGLAAGVASIAVIMAGGDVLPGSMVSWAFVVWIAMSWLVPVVVPLLRSVIWLVRPSIPIAMPQTR